MKKITRSILCLVFMFLLGSINIYAETDNELILSLQSGKAYSENAFSVEDASPDSLEQQITFSHGSFVEPGEETIKDAIQEEADSRKSARDIWEDYAITIAVEQPNPGTYDAAVPGGGKIIPEVNIGHTFVVFSNYSVQPAQIQAIGFYPQSLGYKDVLYNRSVNGAIADDTDHVYNIQKTFWVTEANFNSALDYVSEKNAEATNNQLEYNLVSFNCTTFARDVMSAANINCGVTEYPWQIPTVFDELYPLYRTIINNLRNNSGCYPGAAGEQIR